MMVQLLYLLWRQMQKLFQCSLAAESSFCEAQGNPKVVFVKLKEM